MKKRIFALIDCDNFYVSCERLFNPKLKNRPVAVMSNNDGCIVSRSEETKKLGIKMGSPVFKNKELVVKHNIKLFSSNYSLYADMSNRVMKIIKNFSPYTEIYSIDESFIELTDFQYRDLTFHMKELKNTVFKWTGIPVSVGIGETKTLSKFASHLAKKNKPEFNGVCNLVYMDKEKIKTYMKKTDVSEVWGIGSKTKNKLYKFNIKNIYDLITLKSTGFFKSNFNVMIERTVLELKKNNCFELENFYTPKKNIVSSRSFGKPVTELNELKQAVSMYSLRACEKLRKQKSVCSAVGVYLTTGYFSKPDYYSNSSMSGFVSATADTNIIIKNTLKLIEKLFKPGYRYKKCGVYLLDLVPENSVNLCLFSNMENYKPKQKSLMKTIDKINIKYNKHLIRPGSAGFIHKWKMKRTKCSKRFTTDWRELLSVK